MKNLKSFDTFNENIIGNTFRKVFNKEEEIALDILNKASDTIFDVEKTGGNGESIYTFELDGKKIKVLCEYSSMDDYLEYSLFIDGVKIKCSENVVEKIYKVVYNMK